MAVQVTFYGVRGSCPCAGERYRRTGGNTSCVLVTVEGEPPLILDLGTGLRALGEALRPALRLAGHPLRANALLTHLHFDHILGLPFFGPLHDAGAQLAVYGPRQQGADLHETLHGAVRPPFFPVPMSELGGDVALHEVGDDDFVLGACEVRARRVPHPGDTLGYRVEAGGQVLAYLPDHQAPLDRRDVPEAVLELCDGADVLVHDGQYTDDEFAGKCDWGHSTVDYAVRVAAEAKVRHLLLFHHDPSHDDEQVEQLVARARQLPDARQLGEVSLAREGMTVDLGACPAG
ncbi:MAG: MBL fold metallo-hydrolase [Acidimicrobiales bacterium]